MPKVFNSGVEFLDQPTGVFELSALELIITICLIWYLAAQGYLGAQVNVTTLAYLGFDPISRTVNWYKKHCGCET